MSLKQFVIIIFICAFSRTRAQNPVADFAIKAGMSEFCVGDTVELINLSTNFSALKWSFGDGFETYFENPKHIYKTPGNQTVSLVAYSSNSKTDTIRKYLTINPLPDFLVSPDFADTTIVSGVGLSISVSGNYSSVSWSGGSSDNSITVTLPGTYRLEVKSEKGCKLEKVMTVRTSTEIDKNLSEIKVLNNILTPNGDGFNDFLMFSELENYEFPLEISIFNSIGKLVFSSKNYQNTWNAENLSFGTYYYIVNSKNRKTGNGFVDVIR
jgi:gliding motility-associated-like protein